MKFSLPPEITSNKHMLAGGYAYTFRHRELGEFGRIVLQEIPNGQCHISSEVVGDPSDPMTDERLKIFRPLGEQINHILESALGSGQHTKPDFPSHLFLNHFRHMKK